MTRETLKDLIDTGIREIYIKSYGYVELSLLGSTWQPFGNKARYIRFVVEGLVIILAEHSSLMMKSLL